MSKTKVLKDTVHLYSKAILIHILDIKPVALSPHSWIFGCKNDDMLTSQSLFQVTN